MLSQFCLTKVIIAASLLHGAESMRASAHEELSSEAATIPCAGVAIDWPTFRHLYSQMVGSGSVKDNVAWEDYKQRCPQGLPQGAQPAHDIGFSMSLIGGVRLGFGQNCVVVPGTGGIATSADITKHGKVLGTVCSVFVPQTAAPGWGIFKEKSSGLCLGWSVPDQVLGAAPCDTGNGFIPYFTPKGSWYCLGDPSSGEISDKCLGMA